MALAACWEHMTVQGTDTRETASAATAQGGAHGVAERRGSEGSARQQEGVGRRRAAVQREAVAEQTGQRPRSAGRQPSVVGSARAVARAGQPGSSTAGWPGGHKRLRPAMAKPGTL